MSWIRLIPTLMTLAALTLGVCSLFEAAGGDFAAAALLILGAGVLDSLDGELARLLKCDSEFGDRLDSYVDTICFGAAPALLAYQVTRADLPGFSPVLGVAIVLAGVYRFARMPGPAPAAGTRHVFRGLPIPVNAVWISLFVLISEGRLLSNGSVSLTHGALALLIWMCTFLFLLLEISDVRYVKPSKPVMALSLGGILLASLLSAQPGQTAGIIACVGILVYSFGVPLLTHSVHPEFEEEMEEDEPITVRR